MHSSLCVNPTENGHFRMHYELGFINNWCENSQAIRKRIEKDRARKPRGINPHPETKYCGGIVFSQITNSKHIQKQF